MTTCGVGGWGGPVAGDPGNDIILSAAPAFGGIDVSWNYPTLNPFAVAYTKVFRALSPNFGLATLRREVSGTFFHDQISTATHYYYWVQLVSVHGTLGTLVGPASATAKPTITAMIEELTGIIDSGLLATTLRSELDQISVLNANLLNEVTDRETGETTLAAAMAAVDADVAQAHTFILNETATRTTQNAAMAEQINGVVTTLGGDIAAVSTSMTALIDGVEGTVNALYTAKVNVNGLVGGFGLANNGTEVEAGFDVDKFWIGRTSADKRKPFIITGGVTYIDQAVIPTLTADKIDTRGLDIRDASGNIIFSSTHPLSAPYAAAGLVNSNITLGSNGALGGGGGGQVTIGGLGYTGDLNASSDVVLIKHGAAATLSGNSCVKTAALAAWDSGVYSKGGYVGGAYVEGVYVGVGPMLGLNTDPTTDTGYASIDYGIYPSSDGMLWAYESGVGTIINPTYAAGDVLSVIYDNYCVRYFQNGVLRRTVPAAPDLRFYLDISMYATGSGWKNLRFGPVSQGTPRSNLMDASWWKVGLTPYSYWVGNGGGDAFYDFNSGPSGNIETVWYANSLGTQAGGGWDSGNAGNGYGNRFPVDPSKTYRFCVPIYKLDPGGVSYWGIQPNTVCDLNTATLQGNPYFASATLASARWYLFVGFVFPAGTTGNSNAGAGIYDMTTGALVSAGSNWTWAASTTTAGTRCYQYYTPVVGTRQLIGRPRVEMVDGGEASLAGLLSTGATSARNPITSANAAIYIASAAIGLAHINTASIGSLSALSAELGAVVVSTTGSMRSGQTAYATGSGWWLGHVGGVPKFSIGNDVEYMRWTGTMLDLKLNTMTAMITGGGNVSVTSSNLAAQTIATRGVSVSGGVPPYTYLWTLSVSDAVGATVYYSGATNTSSITVTGDLATTAGYAYAFASCTATDGNGRNAHTGFSIEFLGSTASP